MQTYKELLAQREALERQIANARASELSEAVSRARGLITEYGLTQEDVFPARSAKTGKAKGTVAAKYRDPFTGATWTGRGRAPLWIAGRDRTQFAI
ncbi:MAG: H-NS family nucleoid-associated regulatory protein [Acidovorax sp.]|uniref:H-NS histone family protein n=1 Tax=Acidovorax sp. TaxID=1872122 RepID=UPI00391A4831